MRNGLKGTAWTHSATDSGSMRSPLQVLRNSKGATSGEQGEKSRLGEQWHTTKLASCLTAKTRSLTINADSGVVFTTYHALLTNHRVTRCSAPADPELFWC